MKTIDETVFRTDLSALNLSVEAAGSKNELSAIQYLNRGRFNDILFRFKINMHSYHEDISRMAVEETHPAEQITILGVGSILFSDEGFGVRVIEKLSARYSFPDHVSIIDGGVLGLNLLSVISEADKLIVIDAVRNNSSPGTLHRLEGDAVPARVRAKNSLHQVDLLEALTMCQVLDKAPETVILGIEPEDIETLSVELTPAIGAKVEDMIQLVTAELDRIGVEYTEKGDQIDVSCDSIQNHQN